MAPPASPRLHVPEGSVVTDPGVGGLGGRHKGVIVHELLRVAHQTVGHFGNLHTVSVQLDVQEGNLTERGEERLMRGLNKVAAHRSASLLLP